MRQVGMALIVLVITTVAMIVVNTTLGQVMDSLFYTFTNLTPTLALTTNWNTTATNQLSQFKFFFQSITFMVLATGIWVIAVIINSNVYTREQ